MADTDLIILRSKADPLLYVITERGRYGLAMDAFHTSDPDDSLIHVPIDRAETLLRGLVDMAPIHSAINTEGLYRHRTG